MLTPELRDELGPWGFQAEDDGELKVSDDGTRLVYVDENGEEYLLAESGYGTAQMDGNARAFLSTVLDVLRAAYATPEPVQP